MGFLGVLGDGEGEVASEGFGVDVKEGVATGEGDSSLALGLWERELLTTVTSMSSEAATIPLLSSIKPSTMVASRYLFSPDTAASDNGLKSLLILNGLPHINISLLPLRINKDLRSLSL